MEITVSEQQGRVPVTVLHLVGDLDVESHNLLETKAQECIQSGTKHILLDLSKVPYVSSYGIRAISQVFSWLKASGGDGAQTAPAGTAKSPYLKLLNPSSNVLNVMSTTGLDMYLDIFTDLNKAIASF